MSWLTAGVGGAMGAVAGLAIGAAIDQRLEKQPAPAGSPFAGLGLAALVGLVSGTLLGVAVASPSTTAAATSQIAPSDQTSATLLTEALSYVGAL